MMQCFPLAAFFEFERVRRSVTTGAADQKLVMGGGGRGFFFIYECVAVYPRCFSASEEGFRGRRARITGYGVANCAKGGRRRN